MSSTLTDFASRSATADDDQWSTDHRIDAAADAPRRARLVLAGPPALDGARCPPRRSRSAMTRPTPDRRCAASTEHVHLDSGTTTNTPIGLLISLGDLAVGSTSDATDAVGPSVSPRCRRVRSSVWLTRSGRRGKAARSTKASVGERLRPLDSLRSRSMTSRLAARYASKRPPRKAACGGGPGLGGAHRRRARRARGFVRRGRHHAARTDAARR